MRAVGEEDCLPPLELGKSGILKTRRENGQRPVSWSLQPFFQSRGTRVESGLQLFNKSALLSDPERLCSAQVERLTRRGRHLLAQPKRRAHQPRHC
jgi:hypothetical protein